MRCWCTGPSARPNRPLFKERQDALSSATKPLRDEPLSAEAAFRVANHARRASSAPGAGSGCPPASPHGGDWVIEFASRIRLACSTAISARERGGDDSQPRLSRTDRGTQPGLKSECDAKSRKCLPKSAQLFPARDFPGILVTAQGGSVGIGHCRACGRDASSRAAGHTLVAEEVG
jgi:hypothetical protein